MIQSTRRWTTPSRRKPRASGDDPAAWGDTDYLRRVNPARAGMIPARARTAGSTGRKPRASGDDPHDADRFLASQQ